MVAIDAELLPLAVVEELLLDDDDELLSELNVPVVAICVIEDVVATFEAIRPPVVF